MRIGIGLLALSAAVGCGDDGSMLPVGGGGGDGGFTFPDSSGGGGGDGGGSGSGSDGSVLAVDASELMGRVCVAEDPRDLNACSDTMAGGLTVRIGTTSTTTAANGTFTISYTGGTQWRVTGSNIVSSFMLIGDYEIPALLRTTYDAMTTANLDSLPPNPGEGAVMIQVINNGVRVAGATGASDPSGAWLAFYDGGSQTVWGRSATGVNGTIWFPSIDVGTATVTVSETTLGDKSTPALPVNDGGITFATVIYP